MRVIHRVALVLTSAQRRHLESLDVSVPDEIALPGGGDPLVAFDISEDHPNWPIVFALISARRASDVVRTEFSLAEIEAAEWLTLEPAWHHGYPQPNELDFGYLAATYDLTNYCERCGIGKNQKAPFQMKREPKWVKRSILQLNWVFDEYFVTPHAWTSVFKPHGIECRAVLDTKGAVLSTVVQLLANEEVGIVSDGLSAEAVCCSKCGRTKYSPVTRGPFPELRGEPSCAMVKTREHFGSGRSAWRGVLVSRAMARTLVAEKVRGATLKPVACSRMARGH
jgi:hypothetical protein